MEKESKVEGLLTTTLMSGDITRFISGLKQMKLLPDEVSKMELFGDKKLSSLVGNVIADLSANRSYDNSIRELQSHIKAISTNFSENPIFKTGEGLDGKLEQLTDIVTKLSESVANIKTSADADSMGDYLTNISMDPNTNFSSDDYDFGKVSDLYISIQEAITEVGKDKDKVVARVMKDYPKLTSDSIGEFYENYLKNFSTDPDNAIEEKVNNLATVVEELANSVKTLMTRDLTTDGLDTFTEPVQFSNVRTAADYIDQITKGIPNKKDVFLLVNAMKSGVQNNIDYFVNRLSSSVKDMAKFQSALATAYGIENFSGSPDYKKHEEKIVKKLKKEGKSNKEIAEICSAEIGGTWTEEIVEQILKDKGNFSADSDWNKVTVDSMVDFLLTLIEDYKIPPQVATKTEVEKMKREKLIELLNLRGYDPSDVADFSRQPNYKKHTEEVVKKLKKEGKSNKEIAKILSVDMGGSWDEKIVEQILKDINFSSDSNKNFSLPRKKLNSIQFKPGFSNMEETNMSGRSQNRRPDYRPYVVNSSSPEFNKFLAEVKVKAVPEDKRTYFEVDNPEQGKNLADTAKKYNIKVTYPGDSNNFSVSGDSPAFKAGQELARTESGLDTDDLDSKAKEAGYEGEDLTNFKFGYNSVDKKAENFSQELISTEVHNMESENQVIEDLVAEDLAAGIKDGSEEFSAACTLYSKKYGVNFSEKYKKIFSERYKKDNFSEDTEEKFNLITEVLGKVVSSIEELRADLDKIQKPEPTVSTDPTTTEEPTDDKNMSSEKYVAISTKTGKKVFTGTKKECDDWLLAVFGPENVSSALYVIKPESSYKNENFADTNVDADNDESKDDDKVKGTKDKPNTKVGEPTSTEGTKSKAYYDGQSTARTDSKKEEFGKDGRAEELATKFGYKKDSKEFSEFVEGYKTAPKDDKQSDEEADRELSTNFSHDEAAARYSELKSYFTSTDF